VHGRIHLIQMFPAAAGGATACNDRSSAPARQRRLPPEQVAAIEALRQQKADLAPDRPPPGLSLSTVGTVRRRLGPGRLLKRLDPPLPVVCYQRPRPGEPSPVDTKKLGRIAGIGNRIRACPRAGKAGPVGLPLRDDQPPPRYRLGIPAPRRR
jgi:hypothetical protein